MLIIWCLTELVFSWIPSSLQVKPLQSARCWSCCRSQPPDIVAIRVTPETLIAKNSSKTKPPPKQQTPRGDWPSHHQVHSSKTLSFEANCITWNERATTSEAATPSKHFTVHSHSKRTRSVQSWWTVKDFRSLCSLIRKHEKSNVMEIVAWHASL